MHERRHRQRSRRVSRLGEVSRRRTDLGQACRDLASRHHIDLVTEHVEQVVLAPHHALGQSGGASRIDEENVFPAPFLVGERLVRLDRCGQTDSAGNDRDIRIVELHEQTKSGHVADGLLNAVGERGVEDDCLRIRVDQDLRQLGPLVAVIDVDRNPTQLERREERLDVRDAVVEVAGDLRFGSEPCCPECAREPPGGVVELAVGERPPGMRHRDPIGELLGDAFPDRREVGVHWPP